MEVAEPSFGKVPSAQERASTMPAIRSGTQADSALATTTTTTASTVVLRNSTAPQDYDRRKSGESERERVVLKGRGLYITSAGKYKFKCMPLLVNITIPCPI